MRASPAGLLAFALALGVAATADAKEKKKKPRHASHSHSQDYSASAVVDRQRNATTFDETQYYEVDSRRLPFGSAAWWRQLEREGSGRKR